MGADTAGVDLGCGGRYGREASRGMGASTNGVDPGGWGRCDRGGSRVCS